MSDDVWRPKPGALCKVVFRGRTKPHSQCGFIIRQTTKQDTYIDGSGHHHRMKMIEEGDVWQVLTDDGCIHHYHQMHLRELDSE